MRTCDGGGVGRRLRLAGHLSGGKPGAHPPLLNDIHEAVPRLVQAAPHPLAELWRTWRTRGDRTMALVEAHHELRVHPAARRWPMAVPLVPPLLLLLLLLWWLQLRALQCNRSHFHTSGRQSCWPHTYIRNRWRNPMGATSYKVRPDRIMLLEELAIQLSHQESVNRHCKRFLQRK
jgi:hypothetical protein